MLRRHEVAGRAQIASVPLDGSPASLLASLRELAPWWALGDDALYVTDWHPVYRVALAAEH